MIYDQVYTYGAEVPEEYYYELMEQVHRELIGYKSSGPKKGDDIQ